MKTVTTAILMTFVSLTLHASPEKASEFKFVFNPQKFVQNNKAPKKPFTITTSASSKEVALKLAAKECFQKLTGGKYPGEERGLDIIDVCANPKM